MKKLIPFLLLTFCLSSCFYSSKKNKSKRIYDKITLNKTDSESENYNFYYDTPICIDSSSYIILPISASASRGGSSFSKDVYSSYNYPRYWNVIFYDYKTEEIKLLSEKKLRISNIIASKNKNNYNNNSSINKVLSGHVLFEIADTDYNQDGELDNDDPNGLFISDYRGNNFQRISPYNENLLYYEVLNNNQNILIKTLRDINNDSVFNSYDESIWYNARMQNDKWQIKEIMQTDMREKIKELLIKQWIKK